MSGWSSLVAHKCKTTKKTVVIVDELASGHCKETCPHKCQYNHNYIKPSIPPRNPTPSKPIQSKSSKPKKPIKAVKVEQPKKPKQEKPDPHSHLKIVPPRNGDLPIINGQITCPKDNTVKDLDSNCRSGCSPYIAMIRHSGTKAPHVRCTLAKGVKVAVEEEAPA